MRFIQLQLLVLLMAALCEQAFGQQMELLAPPRAQSAHLGVNADEIQSPVQDSHVNLSGYSSAYQSSVQQPTPSALSPADSGSAPVVVNVDDDQDKRIKALEDALAAEKKKSDKKTFPTVAVNGVFQADAGWFNQDAASLARFGRIQDGADFRRARLSAKCSVLQNTNYFMQFDFAFFGRPTFTDLWVEQTNVPVLGNVRVGQWKQPFSLEVVSSFRYTTFMERSLLFQPFTPFRRLGVGSYNHNKDEEITWAASVFRSGQDQFGDTLATDGGWGTAERITALPFWSNEGANYLHLGVGHFFNAPPNDTVNFRTIPEFFIGANAPGVVGTSGQAVPGGLDGTPFFVATGNLAVSNYNVIGSEFLWVAGPLSVQSEAMVNIVNQEGVNPTAALPGMYIQTGYFLTGEHRPYDRKTAQIDRVKPNGNFLYPASKGATGMGAWEIAARYSYLNLNDKNIRGGVINDFTAGLNWFMNPYTRMEFNYIHSVPTVDDIGTSRTNMFGLRTQMDF